MHYIGLSANFNGDQWPMPSPTGLRCANPYP